jgi:hypothetical protein
MAQRLFLLATSLMSTERSPKIARPVMPHLS